MLSKIFKNWTKDKLYTFYTNSALKLKLYLKGHGKLFISHYYLFV